MFVHHQAWFGQAWMHSWMPSMWCHSNWQEKHWSSSHSSLQREDGAITPCRRRQFACCSTYCKGRCWNHRSKARSVWRRHQDPLNGYSSERPRGVPQEFKVFARLDKQARYMKGTLPEGPNWDQVWRRVTREFKTGNIIKSELIDPSLGEEVVNAPLVDDMDTVTELWYSPTGEVAPSSTHFWCRNSTRCTVCSCRAGKAFCRGKSELSRCFRQASRRRTRREIWEQTRDVTNEGSEETRRIRRRNVKVQGQPSCFKRPDDIDQCLMDLIAEDRDKYLQVIEGESEPVCEEKIPLLQNWKMKQPHGFITMISVEKVWTPKVLKKQEEMRLKSSKIVLFGKRSPGTRCLKEPELLVRHGWTWTNKMRRIHSTEAA